MKWEVRKSKKFMNTRKVQCIRFQGTVGGYQEPKELALSLLGWHLFWRWPNEGPVRPVIWNGQALCPTLYSQATSSMGRTLWASCSGNWLQASHIISPSSLQNIFICSLWSSHTSPFSTIPGQSCNKRTFSATLASCQLGRMFLGWTGARQRGQVQLQFWDSAGTCQSPERQLWQKVWPQSMLTGSFRKVMQMGQATSSTMASTKAMGSMVPSLALLRT